MMLKDFTKDYKSLFGSDFPWRALGYPSPLAMLQAMNTCAMLTYDGALKDHRVFGVAEGHSYISTPLLNAQWSQRKEELLRQGKGRGKKNKTRRSRKNTAKHGCVDITDQEVASQNHPVGVCIRYKPEPDLQWEREHWKVSSVYSSAYYSPFPLPQREANILTPACAHIPHCPININEQSLQQWR